MQSTFAALIEPYAGRSNIAGAQRVTWPLSESHVCVEVTLADGRRDLILLADPEATDYDSVAPAVRDRFGLAAGGEVMLARFNRDGQMLQT